MPHAQGGDQPVDIGPVGSGMRHVIVIQGQIGV